MTRRRRRNTNNNDNINVGMGNIRKDLERTKGCGFGTSKSAGRVQSWMDGSLGFGLNGEEYKFDVCIKYIQNGGICISYWFLLCRAIVVGLVLVDQQQWMVSERSDC